MVFPQSVPKPHHFGASSLMNYSVLTLQLRPAHMILQYLDHDPCYFMEAPFVRFCPAKGVLTVHRSHLRLYTRLVMNRRTEPLPHMPRHSEAH